MNFFDTAVVIIVGICLVCGGFRGLIREVAGIIGMIAGFYGANTYYLRLTPYMENWVANPGVQKLLCFIFLFCVILVAVALLAYLIRKLMRLVFLGWVDRTFGVIFGTVKGLLISTILFILITTFVPTGTGVLSGSKSAPYLARMAGGITLFVSQRMKNDFYHQLEGLKKEWKL